MRGVLGLGLVGVLVLGCGSAGQSESPSSAESGPAASPAASIGAAASIDGQSQTPSVEPSPSSDASPLPPGDLAVGSVAEVVTDDLRARTEPSTNEGSIILEPLLPRGAKLYVVDGPVGASGYRWYQVLTFDEMVQLTTPGASGIITSLYEGWVAAADTTGEQWVQPAAIDCRGTPSTLQDLIAIDDVTALACFAGTPLTASARILDCFESPELKDNENCGGDTGGATFQPSWFDRTFSFLVPPDGFFDDRSMLPLHLDPLGSAPDPVPLGVTVSVTGQFDHPAASACRRDWYEVENARDVYCRTVFAVTEVAAVR